MNNRCVLVSTVVVVALGWCATACGDDDGVTIDAGRADAARADATIAIDAVTIDARPPADAGPPADLSCIGMSPPATAPDPLVVMGVAAEPGLSSDTPVPGASIEALDRTSDEVIASTTTDVEGVFTLSLDTGGVAVDGVIRATMTGEGDFLPTHWFPPEPLYADSADNLISMWQGSQLELLQLLLRLDPLIDRELGQAVIVVRDCAGRGVAGATVSIAPAAGHTVYLDPDSGLPDTDATATTAEGAALLFNIPPGPFTVSAQLDSTSFHSHQAEAYAGGLTLTFIHP